MPQKMIFQDYTRKVYKRTFLNTVFVVFSYSVDNISDGLLASVNKFLQDNFNSQEDVTKQIFKDGFSFDDEEKGVSYFFSSKHLGVKYLKDDYVSFQQTMMPLIYPLMSFFKNVIDVDIINKVSIRKVNIWSIKRDDKAFDEDKFVKDFLSEELISKAQNLDQGTLLRKTRRLEGMTEAVNFSIMYGLRDKEVSENEKYVGLVLDEIVESESVEPNNVEDTLVSINSILYNIFHWSVSKQTIAYMDQEV